MATFSKHLTVYNVLLTRNYRPTRIRNRETGLEQTIHKTILNKI